jgi:peptidoglycan hydrolase FlgJ
MIAPLPANQTAAAPPPDPALRKAAEAFEAIFMRQMIGAMRAAKLADDMLDSSAANQFRDMFDARIADKLAATPSAGSIAALLTAQWSKTP